MTLSVATGPTAGIATGTALASGAGSLVVTPSTMCVLYVALKSNTVTITSVVGGSGTWTRLTRVTTGGTTAEVWYGVFTASSSGTLTVNFSGSVEAAFVSNTMTGHGGIPTVTQAYAGNSADTSTLSGGSAVAAQAVGGQSMYGAYATSFYVGSYAGGSAAAVKRTQPASMTATGSTTGTALQYALDGPGIDFALGLLSTAFIIRPKPNTNFYMRKDYTTGAAQDAINLITTVTAADSGAGYEPILLDDTYSFNGILLNSGTVPPVYDVYRIDGLMGLPPIDHNEESRDGAHGGFFFGNYFTHRVVVIEGSVYTYAANTEMVADTLKAGFQPANADIPFYFKKPNTPMRRLYARVADFKIDEDTRRNYGELPYQVQLVAQDPFAYDAVGAMSIATASGFDTFALSNAGNAPTYPIFLIRTRAGQTQFNLSASLSTYTLNIIASGLTANTLYVLDTKSRRLTQNTLSGTDVSNLMTTRTWGVFPASTPLGTITMSEFAQRVDVTTVSQDAWL